MTWISQKPGLATLGRLACAVAALGVAAASGTAVAHDVGRVFGPTTANDSVHLGVDIVVGDSRTFAFPYTALTPGAVVEARQIVSNPSAGPLRYGIASASTDPDGRGLRDALRVTIRSVGPDGAGARRCSSLPGPTLYDGPLGADLARIGDVGLGADAGDRVLTARGSEVLCFAVSMSPTAGNALQNASTSTIWTVATEPVVALP